MEYTRSLELQRYLRVGVVPLGNTHEDVISSVQRQIGNKKSVLLRDIPDFEIYATHFKSVDYSTNAIHVLYETKQSNYNVDLVSPFGSFFTYLHLFGVLFVYDMREGLTLPEIEKLYLQECCKYQETSFQLLLVLHPVSDYSREDIEREYSRLVQRLENRTHNTTGPGKSKSTDEIFSIPIYGDNNELYFSDYLNGLSVNRRYSVEHRNQTTPNQINSAFLEDFVDMFFSSLNKYIVSLLTRQLSNWAYQLADGSYSRKILLPEEIEGYRSSSKKQAHRELMIQGSISCVWGDYKTAVDLFFAAANKAKKDPYLEAACNEGKCCCLLSNFIEAPTNSAHLTTMIIEITRMMKEAISHYLKGGYTSIAISTCLKLARFYITIIHYLKTYQYNDLALDILGVTEEEFQSIDNPPLFVIRFLRMQILQCLSQCEEIMESQSANLHIPIMQCIELCQQVGFRRKVCYFMDKLAKYEESEHNWSFSYLVYRSLLDSVCKQTEDPSQLPSLRLSNSISEVSYSSPFTWSSIAYHFLQNMTECVRVIGFTDLRIEHILLLLCCYCNHNDSKNASVVKSLLGELEDISIGIEDYHSSAPLPIQVVSTSIHLIDSSSEIQERIVNGSSSFMYMPSFKPKNKSKKEIWVMGETYAMEITLRNPLPSDITINQLEVLHGNSQLTCIGAKQITIPAHSSISTRVYLIPNSVGELKLTGVRVHLCRIWSDIDSNIHEAIHITVIPPFPQLPLTISSTPSTLYYGESYTLNVGLRCMRQPVKDITIHIKLIKGEKREDVWTYTGEKPGYCITSSIKMNELSSEQGMKFISFPMLPSNTSPSYLAYDQALFSRFASSLPMRVNASLELPFILHFTDTIELQLDIQYSIDPSSKYTRMTSYSYHYVVEEPMLSIQATTISSLHTTPSALLSSPELTNLRKVQQESASKTQVLTSSLLVKKQSSVLVFAPLWLFPSSFKLSHVNLKRLKNQKEMVIDLAVLKNGQSDLSHLSIDPDILRQCLPIWQHLYKSMKLPQSIVQSDNQFVLVHGGVYTEGSVMKMVLEMIRYIKGCDIALNDVFKFCFVFWNCEKEKKYGYLPLSQLFHQWNPSFIQSYRILSDDTRLKVSDVIIRDENQTVLKYSTKGNVRVYRSEKQKLSVLYSVSDGILEANSVHHIIVCGVNEMQDFVVMNEKLVGAPSVMITPACRHHVIQLEDSGCYYIYDCVYNGISKRCVWSGRALCVVIS